MLILARHPNEWIDIVCNGEPIAICITEILGNRVRLGFDADEDRVKIHRREVMQAIERQRAVEESTEQPEAEPAPLGCLAERIAARKAREAANATEIV